DRDLTDIFAIQDEITHAIVEQLKVKLLPQEKKSITQAPTDNIEAYTYYLRGRDFLHRRSKHYSRIARQMFAKAVTLDPNYARAWFAQVKSELATRLFERASQIRPDDYQSVVLRIHCYRSLGRIEDSKEAARLGLQLAERELALHPDDPRPAHLGAGALFELGDMERAREWVARPLAID